MNVAISRKNSRVRNSPYAIQRCKMVDEKNDRKQKRTKNLISNCVNYSVTCHEYFWWRRQSLAEALFRQIPSGQFRMETFHGKGDWSWHLPIAQGCWLRQTHCPQCNVQNPVAAVEYSCNRLNFGHHLLWIIHYYEFQMYFFVGSLQWWRATYQSLLYQSIKQALFL